MSESGVLPARRRGLADEVADRVRDAVFAGIYPPGTPLREVELAAALDVSRGPVREALLRLEREGLVRTAWHRGSTVTELSTRDVEELDSLRGALEQLAVREVIANATEADLDAIDTAVTRMARADTAPAMVGCDIDFHDAVYAAAHHTRLHESWQAIRSQVRLFLLTRTSPDHSEADLGADAESVPEDYLRHVPDEHRELAAALRARDADTALALFAAHRAHAFAVLRNRLDHSEY